MNKPILSWRPVAAATAVLMVSMLGAGAALAGEDDTPLSLTFAHDITRDSNFAKDDNNKYGETINSTSAQISLNKAYGRQRYQGDFTLAKHWYQRLDYLNYDSKDGSGSFTSEFGRNWVVTLNGAYSDTLNPIQNNIQVARVERNMRQYRDGGLQVMYGNGGTYALVGYTDYNKLSYSADIQRYQDANQHTVGAKGIYYSTDLLSYSLGLRRVVTDRPLNIDSYSQVVDKDIDLEVNYQATGISRLRGTVTRQATSYVPDDFAGSKNWVGSAYWTYTPSGFFSYDLNFTRLTGTDRTKLEGPQLVDLPFVGVRAVDAVTRFNNDTITTVFGAAVHAQLTGKITLNANYSLSHYKLTRDSTVAPAANPDEFDSYSNADSSYGHTVGLSVNYAALRSVNISCSVQRYSQAGDQFRVRYNGNSFGCNGNFTINP